MIPESIDRLRRLPFISRLRYLPRSGARGQGYDGKLDLRTPSGAFHLLVEERRSYLSPAAIHELGARMDRLRKERQGNAILLARYVSRPAAESLIARRVNFADCAGNIHLALGDAYNWTVIGAPEPKPVPGKRVASPAQLQLLFQFVTHPESIDWPVRQLESAAGIGKSRAAQARRELAGEGLIVRAGEQYQLGRPALVSDRLVSGYSQILRPKLLVGRFQYPEKTGGAFLRRLKSEAASKAIRYALTGGPAADLLQQYYHGPEIPVYVKSWTHATAQRLRLLPARDGPVIVLRAFGETVFWRKTRGHTIAPPWLVYAELMSGADPRAHEAAQELRRQFLQ